MFLSKTELLKYLYKGGLHVREDYTRTLRHSQCLYVWNENASNIYRE
jgi:hypothetical protein